MIGLLNDIALIFQVTLSTSPSEIFIDFQTKISKK